MMDKPMKYRILVIDDDHAIQVAIKLGLKNENYELQFAADPVSAQTILSAPAKVDLLLLDLHFPERSGLDLLRWLKIENLSVPCLLISGAATAKEAVEGIKLGAFDYLEKPLAIDRLKLSIDRCLGHHQQWIVLNSLLSPSLPSGAMIGVSASMQQVKQVVARYAPTDARVLITGETGTGKEVVAHSLMSHSLRQEKPFLIINSAAIPEALLESELFGHRRGSFTGAVSDRVGKIEMADRGTLFLDEIGDLTLAAQAKLLRFLETGEIQRIGDIHTKKVDVRIIAATSRDLEAMMENGEFRSDLYYRLNVARIHLPPLRERPEDILELFTYFLRQQQSRLSRLKDVSIQLTQESIHLISTYSWPGNVRELKSFAERCSFEGNPLLGIEQVRKLLNPALKPLTTSRLGDSPTSEKLQIDTIKPLRQFKQEAERKYIESVLEKMEGNISRTASKLEIDRSYLHQKINTWKKDTLV
jgi:DNA-binding NtrC family response regulator